MAVKKQEKKDEVSSEKVDSVFGEEVHTKEVQEEVVVDLEDESKKTETVEEVKNITDEEPIMTVTAVEELLQRQEQKWSNKLDSIIQNLKLGKAKKELASGENYIADLEEDWLETPIVFFAYSINFSIHGDKKMGKETLPPQGVVRFKPVIRTKRKGRKGEEVISVSSVKVHSKSLAKYLRTHSQFGIAFFENMDAVLNMNTDWAQRLIEANSSIQRLSDQQIIARCRQEDLPIGSDIAEMRKSLVNKIAEKSIKNQEQKLYGKIKESEVEKKTGREIVERTIE